MANTVIRNEKGEFYGHKRWVEEFPDALKFANAREAGRAIGELDLKDAVEIIEHYGYEDEKLYSLVMTIEGSNNG